MRALAPNPQPLAPKSDMMHPSRRHIHQHAIASDFMRCQGVIEQSPDSAQPLAFRLPTQRCLDSANGNVLKETQRAARRKESLELRQQPLHQLDRKVIERQPRNNHIVRLGFVQFLDTRVVERNPSRCRPVIGVVRDPLLKAGHKFGIPLDKFEPIPGLQPSQNVPSDRPRPRPHLQNPPPRIVTCRALPDVPAQGRPQRRSTRQNGPGRMKRTTKFPPKNPIISPLLAHRCILRLPLAARKPIGDSSCLTDP
jgi:hypothetical protein